MTITQNHIHPTGRPVHVRVGEVEIVPSEMVHVGDSLPSSPDSHAYVRVESIDTVWDERFDVVRIARLAHHASLMLFPGVAINVIRGAA